jgi:hypothetical protein
MFGLRRRRRALGYTPYLNLAEGLLQQVKTWNVFS